MRRLTTMMSILIAFAAVAGSLALCPTWAQAEVSPTGTGDPRRTAAEVRGERILAHSGIHGGLIVDVGCRDAGLTVSLAKASNVLAHGLVYDRDMLEEVRRRIRDAGAYGRVSAMLWEGPYLPYADGMVNLLVVTSGKGQGASEEIERVLAPGGVAYLCDEDDSLSDLGCEVSDAMVRTYLVLDAIGQVTGATLLITGLSLTRRRLLRDDIAGVTVTPMPVGSGYGLGAFGTF